MGYFYKGEIVMFCRNCGKEINDDVSFCPNCGCPARMVEKNQQYYDYEERLGKYETFSLAGFIISLLSIIITFFGIMPIISLALSMIGLKHANQMEQTYKILGIIGVIISFFIIVLTIYYTLLGYSFLSAISNL